MEGKKTLQKIVGAAFCIAVIAFILYAANQIQLNKDSKVIIDQNNSILDSFSQDFKDSTKTFENIDSLKLDETKQTSLTSLAESYGSQIENSKNQLKPGINSPSNNNYDLAVSKFNSYQDTAKELKDILGIKICLKDKYGDYSQTLTNITDLQDAVSKANSFEESKTAITNLKNAYSELITKSTELDNCISIDQLSDLKKSLADNESADKISIENYERDYLDPLFAIYQTADYSQVGAFIDAHTDVSVKLKLPSLFDNSLELCIADKVIEDQITTLTSNI